MSQLCRRHKSELDHHMILSEFSIAKSVASSSQFILHIPTTPRTRKYFIFWTAYHRRLGLVRRGRRGDEGGRWTGTSSSSSS